MTYIELGAFSFSYRSLGVHGFGISSSSNFAVLYEAGQLFLRNGAPLSLEAVARAALRFERRLAFGGAVAADDVYPITYGGMLKVKTQPNTKVRGVIEDGSVSVEPIAHDPRWIADHVVVAVNPHGERHDVPNLLAKLFHHPSARDIVKKISGLAEKACDAIVAQDCKKLAKAVTAYREIFDLWTGNEYTKNVSAIAEGLPQPALAWKPPGGGASQSLIVITEKGATKTVIEYFRRIKWWAIPAYVTGGLCGEFVKTGGDVRITAGHRLDFVGAADLGQDCAIGTPGICCSCAIEPRTEIVLTEHRPTD
jgi:galactokinase/mevalonate kinase-like predicted kinase